MADECVNAEEEAIKADEEERRHYSRIVSAFRCYMPMFENRLERAEANLRKLPASHQELLEQYKVHLQNVRGCVQKNAIVLLAISEDAYSLFGHDDSFFRGGLFEMPNWQDIEKLQATLKSIFRDWTHEGSIERAQCYEPILDAIEAHFDMEKENRRQINILVPGAGVGRLMFEIACRGFTCQGNEVSYFMLLCSYFVLNRCNAANTFTIYPWVHNFANNLTCRSQTRGVKFPDAVANHVLRNTSLMSMAAGDFMEVYKIADAWDCVATCFFIDCTCNIVECIERIYKILKPGGVWINLGPLLYHYTDSTVKQPLIEPPFDIILNIIKTLGFQVQKLKRNVRTSYAHNTESLLQYWYYSVFLICIKPLGTEQKDKHIGSEKYTTNNSAGPSYQEDDDFLRTNSIIPNLTVCKTQKPELSLADSTSEN